MKNKTQETQTPQKSAHQTTGIVTESLTIKNKISSFYLSFLCLIGFTAPFWHAFHGITQREGILGFAYMSSFLYALGNPVFSICVGLLFVYAVKFINNDFRKVFRVIAITPLFMGCYMLIYVLIPKKILLDTFGIRDFGSWVYYLTMLAMTITSGIILKMFQRAIVFTEDALKEKIKKLVRFILNQRKNVKDIEVYEYEMLTVFNEISA